MWQEHFYFAVLNKTIDGSTKTTLNKSGLFVLIVVLSFFNIWCTIFASTRKHTKVDQLWCIAAFQPYYLSYNNFNVSSGAWRTGREKKDMHLCGTAMLSSPHIVPSMHKTCPVASVGARRKTVPSSESIEDSSNNWADELNLQNEWRLT